MKQLGPQKLFRFSTDKKICNYDTQSTKTTISPTFHKALGFNCSKIKWWDIYLQTYQEISTRTVPSLEQSQDQETFLAPATDKQTHNYETEYSDQLPFQFS